jgi:hypothetical protein
MRPSVKAIALAAGALAIGAAVYRSAWATEDAAWDLQQLMTDLARAQHAKARFVEHKHLQILKKPIELTGTLEYRAPDHIARQTLTPKPESFVVEGDRLTLENARGQKRTFALQDNPVLWAFVESIRSTLKGDLTTLQRFYAITLDGGSSDWRLSLVPKEPKMRAIIDAIRIGGAGGAIRMVEIRQSQGDWSEMSIHEAGP